MGWKVENATTEGSVTARFEGHLTAAEGEASAVAFRAAFEDGPLDVVWDVSSMTGFDGGGNYWQYNRNTGYYNNLGTGRTCVGKGLGRTCF